MRDLKFSPIDFKISNKAERFEVEKAIEVKRTIHNNYSIDEILDKVEDGDLSILKELGISYTEITTETGDRKISFNYQGTRYTVNIINKPQESEGTNNTKTVTNEDGSYTVFEYDNNGNVTKSTEYDKDGKITHEYNQKQNGDVSDKYYTYEDGKLIQIQETIHYTNGNYTYIFTDANGNLKEIQKVIQNEQGGTTFDITNEDGSREVHECSAEGRLKNRTYYSSNGELIKTEDYYYDANNSNIYTIVTKNPEGKVILEEVWENYTFIDEEGKTWHGCRLLERIDYKENESKISNLKETISTLKDSSDVNNEILASLEANLEKIRQGLIDLPNKKAELHERMRNLYDAMLNLSIPAVPKTSEFLRPDGSLNEEAYNEAMNQYEYELYKYDKKVYEITTEIALVQKEIWEIDMEIKTQTKDLNELEQNVNSIRTIQDLINSTDDKGLISELNELMEKLNQNIKAQNEARQKRDELKNLMLNLEVPKAPAARDFTNSDGSLNEEAYQEALNEYEYAKFQYDRKMTQEYNPLAEEISNTLEYLRYERDKILFDAQKIGSSNS